MTSIRVTPGHSPLSDPSSVVLGEAQTEVLDTGPGRWYDRSRVRVGYVVRTAVTFRCVLETSRRGAQGSVLLLLCTSLVPFRTKAQRKRVDWFATGILSVDRGLSTVTVVSSLVRPLLGIPSVKPRPP